MSLELAFRFLLLVLFIGLSGWCAWRLFFSFPSAAQKKEHSVQEEVPFAQKKALFAVRDCFFIFLSGIAFLSPCMLVLGIAGIFRMEVLAGLFGLLVLGCCVKAALARSSGLLENLPRYLAALVLVTAVCLGLSSWISPFETPAYSLDSPVFVGASNYIDQHGKLRYDDHLASEMTKKEKDLFFTMHYDGAEQSETIRIRHRGGVFLFGKQEVAIGFFHLFPLWLSLGTMAMGDYGSIYMMSLLAVLVLLTLFYLGKTVAGNVAGLSITALSLTSFPMLYHFCMPLSELLCQLLALSGILLLMHGSGHSTVPCFRRQLMAGFLFGACLFTKLEMLVLLPLCFSALFLICPAMKNKMTQWRPLLLTAGFFFLSAINYQFYAGSYFHQIRNWCQDIVLLRMTFDFLHDYPFSRLLILIVLWIVPAKLLKPSVADRFNASIRRIVPGLVLLSILVVFFGVFLKLRFEWPKIAGVYEWITSYQAPWSFFILVAGLICCMAFVLRKENASTVCYPFIFFMIPAVVYFIDPMIHHFHPFAIRRFVPLFFPLLFALAVYGWHGLAARTVKIRFAPGLSVVLITVLCAFGSAGGASILYNHTLFRDVVKQLREPEKSIPEDALVLISKELASHALHIGMQYLNQRDTLLLVEDESISGEEAYHTFESFLRWQSAQRKIFLVLEDSSPAPALINRQFALIHVKNIPVHFWRIRQAPQFERVPESVSYNYQIFELVKWKDFSPDASQGVVINVGKPEEDLPYLQSGFYFPESDAVGLYRWTKDRASMILPAATSFRMLLGVSRPDNAEKPEIQITINGQQVETVDKSEHDRVWMEAKISSDLINEKPYMELCVLSSVFIATKEKESDKVARELGVRIYQVELPK